MSKDTSISNDNAQQLEGRMPLKAAIPLGLQHVLAMFAGNLTPVILIAGGCDIASGSDL